MTRGRKITPDQRRQVMMLRNVGKMFREIAAEVGTSAMCCCQAIQHINRHRIIDDVPRKIIARKTDARTDRIIHRFSKANRFKTAVDIHKEIASNLDKNISVRTV